MIPYGRQVIDQADIEAVAAVLQSDYLTQGPVVPRFEAAFAKVVGAVSAVAVNSATSALHIAYIALGLGPGKRLWTVPNTFVATANAALYCGAEVDFVDIDLSSRCLCIKALESKLIQASAQGILPDIVVPVHFAGASCDMAAIADLAKQYGFRVVEDASHAIGAQYQGQAVGNCAYSDIAVFSLHPVKIITSGEGGVATCRDAGLAERMRLLRSHGITRALCHKDNPEPWWYEQLDLGFNYRMTDIHAALGLSQLGKLAQFLCRRRALAKRYQRILVDSDIAIPRASEDSAWHLYTVLVDADERTTVFQALRQAGVGVNVHYIPVYWQPYYRQHGFVKGYCPVAEQYYACTLSLPLYPNLSTVDQDFVVAQLLHCASSLRTASLN